MQRLLSALLLGLFLSSYSSLSAQYFDAPTSGLNGNWAIGIQVMGSQIQGDVQPLGIGYGGGLIGQKNISRHLDLRISLFAGQNLGQDLEPSTGYRFNPAWNGSYNEEFSYQSDSGQVVFHNYRFQGQDVSAQIKLNLNRFFSAEGGENLDVYALAGVGVQLYQTLVDTYNGQFQELYAFEDIPLNEVTETQLALQNLSDGFYETWGERDLLNNNTVGNSLVNTVFLVGGGIRFRLAGPLSLGLDATYLFAGDDLLDGQQWLEDNTPSPDTDKLLRVGILLDYTIE